MKIKMAALLGFATLLASTSAFAQIKIPEGTEFPVRLEEAISSSAATEGDRFTIVLDDDVKLADGTVLRAGYRGVGEVVEARDNGMLGKNGKLNVRLSYLKVGDERIRLRATKGTKGETRVGATVVTVLLFWPSARPCAFTRSTTLFRYVDRHGRHPLRWSCLIQQWNRQRRSPRTSRQRRVLAIN